MLATALLLTLHHHSDLERLKDLLKDPREEKARIRASCSVVTGPQERGVLNWIGLHPLSPSPQALGPENSSSSDCVHRAFKPRHDCSPSLTCRERTHVWAKVTRQPPGLLLGDK